MADYEINRRLRKIIEEVYKVSPVEFAKKYQDKKAVKTYNILSERNGVSQKMLVTILEAYPEINKVWLLTGIGEKIINPDTPISTVKEPEAIYPKSPQSVTQPTMTPHIIDECADCGKPNGFGIAIMEDRCPKYAIPGLSGHDFTIIARGRSMINRSFPEKSIKQGDIVGCKKWNSRSHIRWGEVYALSTPDGITIKQIQPSEKEGYIKCIPFNTEEQFQPFDLPLNEIYDWAIVVGVASVMIWA